MNEPPVLSQPENQNRSFVSRLFPAINSRNVATILITSIILSAICVFLFIKLWTAPTCSSIESNCTRNESSDESEEEYPFFPHSSSDDKRIREMIDTLNGQGLSWEAEYNPLASLVREEQEEDTADFSSLIVDGKDLDDSIGTNYLDDTEKHLKELAVQSVSLPPFFDARQHWSQCWTVHQIQNQGGCGSCWATAAASVMSDRLCISSNFTKQSMFSIQDLLSCCDFCGRCQGTTLSIFPLIYWKRIGVVSGGSLGSNEGCRPYEIPSTCGAPCPLYYIQTKFNPICDKKCQPLFTGTYENDLVKVRSVYFLQIANSYKYSDKTHKSYNKMQKVRHEIGVSSVDLIKREILLHGPLYYCTFVSEPFMHYRSGVFTYPDIEGHSSLQYGHCLKLIGWGKDQNSGLEYWTVANSWGRTWGENGFGKIVVDYLPDETSVIGALF